MDIRFDDARVIRPNFELSLDLTFPAGEITALIGPSGAGKSTLLELVAGFEAPANGRVFLGGTDVTADGPAERPVSIVFQDNNLFPHLTVAQNVGLGIDPSGRLSSGQEDALANALDEVGLTGFEDRLPAQLSGGQQSRVALARALLRDRPVLLLDEPFAALGPGLKVEMLGLVEALSAAHQMTVLMVTHDTIDARRIAAKTALVADGQVAPPVATQELFENPPPVLKAYLGI